jgi:hypothetical protein
MAFIALGVGTQLGAPHGADAFLEYESTNGIADIVFARFDDDAARIRGEGQLSGAYRDRAEVAILLALDEEETRSSGAIASIAALSDSTVASKLRSLVRAGAADRCDAGGWVRRAPFPCRLAEATAVELKLANWRRALDQAARYRAFADRTTVVMSEQHGRAALQQAAAFAFNRVGLSVLSEEGQTQTIIEPEAMPPFDPIARFLAGERLWARLGASEHTYARTSCHTFRCAVAAAGN